MILWTFLLITQLLMWKAIMVLSHPTSNSSANPASSPTTHTPKAAPSHHQLLSPWPQSHSTLPSLPPTHIFPPIANSPGKATYLTKLKSDQYYPLLKTLLELLIPPGTDPMRPCLCSLLTVLYTVLITTVRILQLHILLWGLCTCWFPTWNVPPIPITMAHFLTLVRSLLKCHLKETHLDHWSEVLATFCTLLFGFILIGITTWCLFLAISMTSSYLKAGFPLSSLELLRFFF